VRGREESMKVLALYLPQFHEVEENNIWWGKGYTEWTALKTAKKYSELQRQPRVPLNMNYYDLSDVKVIRRQAELARKYGIDGWVIYHYWFKGKKMLYKPVELLLENSDIDINYCFSWANESWRKNWFMGDQELLIKQEYGDEEDWKNHYSYLRQFFHDPRYIKQGNSPVFIIYNTLDIGSDFNRMFGYYRKLAKEDGFDDLYIVQTLKFPLDERKLDVDAYFLYEPAYSSLMLQPMFTLLYDRFKALLVRNLNKFLGTNVVERRRDFERIAKRIVENKKQYDKPVIRGFFTDWDNTPRRATGPGSQFFYNSSPNNFRIYFDKLVKKVKENGEEYIIINAWNEWGEGAHLEPDEEYKFGYLEAVKDVVEKYR